MLSNSCAIWSRSSEVWSSSSAGALELHLPPLLLHAGTNKQTRAAAPLTPCQPCHPSSSPPAQSAQSSQSLRVSKASCVKHIKAVRASVLPQEGRSRWEGGGLVGKQLTVLLRDPAQDCEATACLVLHCSVFCLGRAATRDKF